MKKILISLVAAICCIASGNAALLLDNPFGNASVGAERVLSIDKYESLPTAQSSMKEIGQERFKPVQKIATDAESSMIPRMKKKTQVKAKVAEIAGADKTTWVVSSSNHLVTKSTSTVTNTATNEYLVEKFIFSDVNIKLTVNPQTGAVAIPVQPVVTSDGNIISICKANLRTGTYSTTDSIKGIVTEDGAIHINDNFGFFVTEGPMLGAYLNIGILKHGVIGKSNATFKNSAITFKDNTQTTANREIVTTTYNIYAYENEDNQLRMMGVPVGNNIGEMIATLKPGNVVEIDPQPAYLLSVVGEFYYYPATQKVDASGNVTFSVSPVNPLSVTYSANTNKIQIGTWAVARTSSLLCCNQSSEVTLTSPITFPAAPTFNLEGDGSQANPYLIKNASDFVLLGYETLSNSSIRSPQELIPYSTEQEYYYPVYKGKYFKLANDIDFSVLNQKYTPIGTKNLQFAGNLDGDGHTISNLNIEDYAYDYAGLFSVLSQDSEVSNIIFDSPSITTIGYTAGTLAGRSFGSVSNITINKPYIYARAGYNVGSLVGYGEVISNVKVTNAQILSLGFSGGIVGRCYSSISDCSVQGTISGGGKQTYNGGIVAHMSKHYTESPTSIISNCSFSGNVYSSADEIGLGGIAGGIGYTKMENCYANAVVQAVSDKSCYLGGLTGPGFQATIEDCYATGYVRNLNTPYAGGLVGKITSSIGDTDNTVYIKNSYASTMLETKSTEATRGIIGAAESAVITNSYFDAQMAATELDSTGLSTLQMTSKDGLTGFSSDKWIFNEGMYPRLKESVDSIMADVAIAVITLPAGMNVKAVEEDFTYAAPQGVVWSALMQGKQNTEGGYAFNFKNGTGVLNYFQQTDTIFASEGNISKYILLNIAPASFEGKGTAEEPWKIQSKADLELLSSMALKASLSFKDRYFIQTADIDMQGAQIEPICKDASAKIQFLGSYDGNNHTIDNLKIQAVGYFTEDDATGTNVPGQVNPKSAQTYSYSGLFATIGSEGIVKNLRIGKGCQYDLYTYGGAIAGSLFGKIDNCYNFANINEYFSNAGGIVGYAQKDSKITNCFNSGSIKVNYGTGGGIVGLAATATIQNCENTGEILGVNINPNQKDGIQSKVGGIVGQATSCEISDVVNSGIVSAFNTAGGIIGVSTGTAAAPNTVNNALNYGFIYSTTTPLSLGAISGTNAFTNYSNCFSDSRLQHIGMTANCNVEGASSIPTEEILGKKLFNSENWTIKEGNYPMIALSYVPEMMALNSSAIITFTGYNFAEAVNSAATLSAGQTWTVSPTGAFNIKNNTLEVTVPEAGIAEAVLTASQNGVSRQFPLKSFNYAIFDGEGTPTNPYLIKTADDFLSLADKVNTTGFNYSGLYFSQPADLDFADKTFVPVGLGGKAFGGNYNGNKHEIKNLSYSFPTTDKTVVAGGLFNILDASGSISNLTINESCVISTYSFAAGFTAYSFGKISNCVNKAAISTYGTTNAGGITALAYPGAEFSNCENYGAITAKTNYAGGILGSSAAQSKVTLSNCSNHGAVTGVSKNGGIVGSGSCTITTAANDGNVTSTTSYAGGVIGEALLPSSVNGATNKGVITTPQYCGGIAATAAAHNAATKFILTDCHNSVDIAVGAKGYGGGVAGSLGNYATLTNCTNTGKISVSNIATTSGIRVAGVAGTCGTYTNVTECYNTGDIEAYSNSGGVIGVISGNAVIERCYNTGNVTVGCTSATAANSGGVAGNLSSPFSMTYCWNDGDIYSEKGGAIGGVGGAANGNLASDLKYCYNTGNVTGAGYVGGIGGTLRATTKYCINYGDIKGGNGTAGIGGFPYNAASPIYEVIVDSCFNLGKVISTNANSAAIVGKNASCKYLTTGVNYYNKDICTATAIDKELSPKAVGLTTRELTELQLGNEFANVPACYPIFKYAIDDSACTFKAAQVILAEGDTYDKVTQDFNVGIINGVQWTGSSNLTVGEYGSVKLASAGTSNEETGTNSWIKKTAGELSETIELVVYSKPSGIDSIDNDENIVSVSYYTLDGKAIAQPQERTVVIRRVVYQNGTVKTSKIMFISSDNLK